MVSESDRAKLSELIGICVEVADAHEGGGGLSEEMLQLQADLARRLAIVFDNLAAAVRKDGWEVDPDRSGYFFHRGEAGDKIFVPWNIGPDLPSNRPLESFLAVAHRLRSNAETTICLSGSAAAYGAFGRVGDLDFCEYLPESEQSISVALEHASSLDGDDFCLLEVSLRGLDDGSHTDFSRPWDLPPWEAASAATTAEAAPVGKFDFVTRCEPEGVVEVTNLVLSPGQEVRSHPLQEVALGTWVPRDLATPRTVGDYARFLRGSIEHLVGKSKLDGSWEKLVKAAKRAVSLLRLHFRAKETEALLDLLEEGRLPLRAALAARVRLWDRLTASPDDTLEQWRQPLVETLRDLVSEFEGMVEDLPKPAAATDWITDFRERIEPSSDTLSRLEARLDEALR